MNPDVLRFARDRKGWTQAQLAQRLGTHQSIISGIERGQGDLPIRLMVELCDALDIKPASLFDLGTGSAGDPAYVLTSRISHNFLRGRHRALGEIFQALLEDLTQLRVDLLALTVHLFDRRPIAYAGAIAGQYGVTWREHVIDDPNGHLNDTRGDLFRGWRKQQSVRKPGQLCAMPDYEPAVVFDVPVSQGMVGFGFKRELADCEAWARVVADAVSEGLGLLDEVGKVSNTNLAAEVADLQARLASLEKQLAPA